MHSMLVSAGGPVKLTSLKDQWLKFHGHKCNIERFLVVGEGGIGATLKRIPHVVKLVQESGATYVKAAQPADLDQAGLIEEDKRYRKELASRNAAKAAAMGTSKATPASKAVPAAAPPAAPATTAAAPAPAAPAAAEPAVAEGKRPAEGAEGNAEKKPRNEQETAMLGRMLMQGVVRVLQNRAKNNQGALPLADLETEFKELWKVPFNVKEAGETDALSFLRKWPAKVELQKDNDSWKLALPKKFAVPTAAKSAPAEPPPKAGPEVPPTTPAPPAVPPAPVPKKGGPPSRPPANIEDFLWNMHSLLHATEGPLELEKLREQYQKHFGHKCNVERFLVVGEGGISATLKRIPHVVTVYSESGTTYVKATMPADIDQAQLKEEDKRYRLEIQSRNAAKAASVGTSKAAPPKAPAASGEGKRPAEGENSAEKKPRTETDPVTLGRMLIQGVVRVLQNRVKANKGALPVSDLEREFEELWGVPFNYKEAGEAEAVSFLRKWSAKVEVFGEPDAWMVQLAKRGPTAAKSAPAEAPAKAAPPEAPAAAADAAGATTASPQDGQAAATPRVANAAAAASDPVLAQRLTDLEQKANGALEVMRSLLKQQEALVAELHKLKS